jgi:uncharacterized protein DUF3300
MDKSACRTKRFLAILCSAMLLPDPTPALHAAAPQATVQTGTKIPNDQLDSLVAPIALFPDPLLAQTLAASTYPLELIQLHQWLLKNKDLKDKALADAVAKQPWDASIQGMAGLPDVVKRLADDIQWTTDLGNAFLAQQQDVMDAVQRMRIKAKDAGHLKSNEQVKVETKVVESKTVVVVEQANPQVVYVPAYNPTVVYGVPIYPYPPIYYPPYYGMAVAFSAGVFMGAMWGGGWGYGCGWGGGNIYINNNNNFNRINHYNRNNIGSGNIGSGNIGSGNSNWQHRPEHRGGTPYSDRGTADRFGGNARGDSLANRQSGARQQLGNQGGNLPSQRPSSGLGNSSLGSRTGSAAPSVSNRASGISSSGTNRSSISSADRVGSRDLSRSSSSGISNRSAFGGGSGGFSGSSARSSSARGAGSMRGGGGARRR